MLWGARWWWLGALVAVMTVTSGATAQMPANRSETGVLLPSSLTNLPLGFGKTLVRSGGELFVGAPYSTPPGGNRNGAVFVFERTPGGWSQVAELMPADAFVIGFGLSIAIRGDWLFIGGSDFRSRPLLTNPEQVHVYRRLAGVWTEAQVIPPPPVALPERFGASLAFDGVTLIVGSPQLTAGGRGEDQVGHLYLYELVGTAWELVGTLAAEPTDDQANLGFSMDLDGNRLATLAWIDRGRSRPGSSLSVHLFERTASGWSKLVEIAPLWGADVSNFLAPLTLGAKRVVVGFPNGRLSSWSSAGHVGVWDWPGPAPLGPMEWVSSPDFIRTQEFGTGLDVNEQLLLVGSALEAEPPGWNYQGAAYVYVPGPTGWVPKVRLREAAATENDAFGASVLLDGNRALVGAPGLGTQNEGKVYLFDPLFAANGEACGSEIECGSGFCVDGVCCDSPCAGGESDCQACSAEAGAPQDGRCELVVSGRSCRRAEGLCDLTEVCDGTSPACPEDQLLPSSHLCREIQGVCDVADHCDGTRPECPFDRVQAQGTLCRLAEQGCNRAEVCDGSAAECPPDSLHPPGTICRPATGDCDEAEICDGLTERCPRDGFLGSAEICRPAEGGCDLLERCAGTGPVCPADRWAQRGTTCRASSGACDPEELCDGSSAACASDQRLPLGTLCRPSAGPCDLDEACDGVAPVCPPDEVVGEGAICREALHECDRPEACDGTGGECPPNAGLPAGTVCREARGLCDLPETCRGGTAPCPEDRYAPVGSVCRPAAHACDAQELCEVRVDACPEDLAAVNGAPCDDGQVCSQRSACQQGSCVRWTAVDCDDSDPCTLDLCDEALGCRHADYPECSTVTEPEGCGCATLENHASSPVEGLAALFVALALLARRREGPGNSDTGGAR